MLLPFLMVECSAISFCSSISFLFTLSAFIDWMKQYVMRMVMYYVQQCFPVLNKQRVKRSMKTNNKQRVKSSMKTKVGLYNNLPLPEIVLCTRWHNLHCANSLSLLWK
jgi:hypothetical protein